MKFIIAFDEKSGTFAFDKWPDDLNETVGRLVVDVWKTIYTQQTDRFVCGRIIAVRGALDEPKIEYSTTGGGTCTSPLADLFLVPMDAEDGLSALLGPKHKAMRVSASGLLRGVSEMRIGKLYKNCLLELAENLSSLGDRFYEGDVKVVDEFLQFYALDKKRKRKPPSAS